VKNAPRDWIRITEELPGISQVLEEFAQQDGADIRSPFLHTLTTLIPHYRTELRTLQKMLDINMVRKPLVQMLLWPLRKADTEHTMVYLFHFHYRLLLALEWHASAQSSSQRTAESGKMKGSNGLRGMGELSKVKLGMSLSPVPSKAQYSSDGYSIM
jgi:hypothetical protein